MAKLLHCIERFERLSQLQTIHSSGTMTQKNKASVGHYWFVFVP